MPEQRIDPVLVEKVSKALYDLHPFDTDRPYTTGKRDAEAAIRVVFDELGLKGEWRAAASDEGDGLSDRNGRCSTRREAEASLESLLDAEPPYDKGWIESRVVSDWRPVEQGDPQ